MGPGHTHNGAGHDEGSEQLATARQQFENRAPGPTGLAHEGVAFFESRSNSHRVGMQNFEELRAQSGHARKKSKPDIADRHRER